MKIQVLLLAKVKYVVNEVKLEGLFKLTAQSLPLAERLCTQQVESDDLEDELMAEEFNGGKRWTKTYEARKASNIGQRTRSG